MNTLNLLLSEKYAFYSVFAMVFIVTRIPFIGNIIKGLNTLIHESGHAIVALITSGDVVSIDLRSDTSGTAVTKSSGRFGKIFTSLAGYIFSSVSAWLLFYLIQTENYSIIIYFLLSLALVNLMFWIRNLYGFIWIVGFSAALCWILYTGNQKAIFFTCLISASIVLLESVLSAITVFYLSFTQSAKSGDAKNLSDSTFIPAFIWGTFFLIQAAYFAYLSIKVYLPNELFK